MNGGERRAPLLVMVVLFIGGTVVGVFATDQPALRIGAFTLAIAGLAGAFISSRAARTALAHRFPWAAALGRGLFALRPRTIALTFAGCVLAVLLGELWKSVAFPRGDLGAYLERAYGPEHRSDRSPLMVAAEIGEEWPAEDQRYTASGVLLRYERDIVALVPDGRGGTTVEREDDDEGYRRYFAYVGDLWGRRYHERVTVPRSAMALPQEADLQAVERRLRDAGADQGVCYRWDVEIRSGRREGRFHGAVDPPGCRPYVKLVGWVDPTAGRFRRGPEGEWRLGYEWTLEGTIPTAAIEAIEVPFNEMIEGALQSPAGDGTRPGKGMIEHLEAMPLLAQEAVYLAPVLPPAGGAPGGARPAPVERPDSERRAEASWVALPSSLLQVGAGFVFLFALAALLAGAVRRLLRRLRAADPA